MKSVFDKLQNLEFVPSEERSETTAPSSASNELAEHIRRRAEQLSQERNARNGGENAAHARYTS